jgi:hypothetical protein
VIMSLASKLLENYFTIPLYTLIAKYICHYE